MNHCRGCFTPLPGDKKRCRRCQVDKALNLLSRRFDPSGSRWYSWYGVKNRWFWFKRDTRRNADELACRFALWAGKRPAVLRVLGNRAIWVTKRRKPVMIRKMDPNHLQNTIRMIRREAVAPPWDWDLPHYCWDDRTPEGQWPIFLNLVDELHRRNLPEKD